MIWLVIKLLFKLQSFKKFTQINSETVRNSHDKEIPKEKHVSPEERQEIIDELILK